MASEVVLPKQGNSVESCIIVGWKIDEGSPVSKGDILMEVETDKATMEVESTADGVLLKQLVSEGDDVPVLSPVAIVGEAGEEVDDRVAGKKAGADETTAAASSSPAPRGESHPAARARAGEPARKHRGGAKISPRARRLAESEGVEYERLSGSGPGGRIMVRDVQAAATERAGQNVDTAEPGTATPIRGMRKLIAERMHASLASTAQLTMDASADARALLAYRARLKAADAERLQSVSINDLVLYAASRVLRDFPALNATFSDGVVRTYDQVDLGFAVDTPRGLMVPVIRGADRRSLADLAAEAHRLAKGCLEGGITPDELSGGTFSVTNLGAFGIERFTPVLNAPQVAILGVCAITQRPAPNGEGTIPAMGLSLTIDHQVVDGAPAARFLQALGRAVAQIDLTLAE
ncbi:MAG: dihydrolipoamide acetyltransferase family protein [Spirochaetota bacterium]